MILSVHIQAGTCVPTNVVTSTDLYAFENLLSKLVFDFYDDKMSLTVFFFLQFLCFLM